MGESAGKIHSLVNPLSITYSCLLHQNIPALFIPMGRPLASGCVPIRSQDFQIDTHEKGITIGFLKDYASIHSFSFLSHTVKGL